MERDVRAIVVHATVDIRMIIYGGGIVPTVVGTKVIGNTIVGSSITAVVGEDFVVYVVSR